MSKSSAKLREEKYPSRWTTKSTAKKNGKARMEFNLYEPYGVYVSPFMLRMVTIMISIVKELTEDNYHAIEQANAQIRQLKATYEAQATLKARAMTNAKINAERPGANRIAHEALYVKARGDYESYRADTKGKMAQQVSVIRTHKRVIENCADSETTYCNEILALYWEVAKKYFRKLDANPPSLHCLTAIAELGMPEIQMEDTSLTDVSEYFRNEAALSLSQQQLSEPPAMLMAAATVCPDCNTENQTNAKFCCECGHRFKEVM